MEKTEIPDMEIFIFPNQIIDLIKNGESVIELKNFKIKLTTSVNDFNIERFDFLKEDE